MNHQDEGHVNILIQAVHDGARVEVNAENLKSVITDAVKAGMPKEGPVIVNIEISAIHYGAKVVVK